MHKFNRLFASAIALTVIVSGCGGSSSRPRILSTSGVNSQLEKQRAGVANSVDEFLDAAEAARPTLGAKGDAAAQMHYMDAGFGLIRMQCGSYIDSKADNQRRVNVWRDTFAPATALISGVIALSSDGETVNKDILTALSLGTAATNAGFKIYEERYLFSARNVHSVRKLVLDALQAHEEKALETGGKPITFRYATDRLIEHQHICSPPNILELVSKSIDSAKVSATRPGDESVPTALVDPSPSPTPTAAATGGPLNNGPITIRVD